MVHLSCVLTAEVMIVRKASYVFTRLVGGEQPALNCLMPMGCRMILGVVHIVCREEGCSGKLAIGREFRAIVGLVHIVCREEGCSGKLAIGRDFRAIVGLVHIVCREEGCSGKLAIGRDFRAIWGFVHVVVVQEGRS